ncbi:type II toxin-antitoxin system RelE/ParE family toxin [Deinococcus ficus]|uniref:type II toxin-antitoxin system RelE/ParE family toxin n=1 Tax=Deinococcus ficus TaxID=317577 RepID=UPI0003B60290|nr:type II toxin-antitoxin system RelE/ParE family toxin [Deinococcus ficus]
MPWTVILLSEVSEWFDGLDSATAVQVAAALDLLEERGPALGRPLVDTLQGSELPNLKELRPGSVAGTEIRILFTFDPTRQAILLTAGDKAGQWKSWYQEHIPLAEDRYRKWLAGEYDEEE